MWLSKWLPFPFIGLCQYRRAVPPLCFGHSYMRSVVAGRLVSLLLPTMLVVCFCSINVLTRSPCIPWLWLIYLWSVGEPQDLTGNPYVQWIFLGCPFLQNYWRASLVIPDTFLFDVMSLLYNVVYCFISYLWLLPPFWE